MDNLVVLFDVDGTLISTDGAGKRAIQRAFARLHDGSAWLDFSFAGMTDPAIVREGLRRGGCSDGSGDIAQVLSAYVGFLREEMERDIAYRVLPGVRTLVEALSVRPNTAVGLGTGNVHDGARIKLERGALNEHFSFGGFGSDHESRAALLQTGADRGAAILGVPLNTCRVVVVGDTLRDVSAAHEMGAECLAVATGPCSVAALAKGGAACVVSTLEQAEAHEMLVS